MVILILMYAQAATVSILAIFLLNLKVFRYGCKITTRMPNQGLNNSFPFAATEFKDAISYLNSTTEENTYSGSNGMTESQMKREIRSYGVISIREESVS